MRVWALRNDLMKQCSLWPRPHVRVGKVNDHGFIKTAEAVDPDGNEILFIQEIQQAS